MTDELLSTMMGLIMPPFVDFVRLKLGMSSSKWVFAIALVSSLLLSALSSFLLGKWDGSLNSLLANFALVFAGSQTVYNLYWKQTDSHEETKAALE